MSTTQQYTARHRYARITARKARLVADLIRGKSVNRALELLEFAPQRAASFYSKLVRSAMANASQTENVDVNALLVSDCRADDGPLLNNRMRYRPGPQGRAMPFRKRTSHLTVGVAEPQDAGPEPEGEAGAKTIKQASKPKTAKRTVATKASS
jgi:large subunit ribosomal protein L22